MTFKLSAAFCLVSLTILGASCAAWQKELRSGWAKVDFRDGKLHDSVVCQINKDADGDMLASCISIEDFAEMMAANGLLERHGRSQPHDERPGEL